jgi:hypothetical protein
MNMNFKKWLEDTGEVRIATLTNDSLGIPSKYTQSNKWKKSKPKKGEKDGISISSNCVSSRPFSADR